MFHNDLKLKTTIVNIALFGRELKPDHLEYFRLLTGSLEDKGTGLLLYEPFYDFLKDKVIFREPVRLYSSLAGLKGSTDLLISVGGDGTLLEAVRIVRDSGIAIAGINLGRMGFLSSIQRRY